MTDINKDLEKEIVDLKRDIEKDLIDLRQENMSEELRDLRHKVLTVHTEIENQMEISVFLELLHAADPKDTMKSIPTFMKKTNPILTNLGFSRIFSLYKDFKDPQKKNSELLKKISELNGIRIEFAHPKRGVYKKYEDRGEYKKALEIIKEALEGLKATILS